MNLNILFEIEYWACRHEASSFPDLGVQLDVFEEQRESDEANGPGGINLNSHLDVFYAILKQVTKFTKLRIANVDIALSVLWIVLLSYASQEI